MDIGGIVLGSLLSSVFQILFDKLTSLALGYAKREGISTTLVNDWKKKLVILNAVMVDAEDRELSGDHSVKLWLEDVKDLAYDMEDLLDDFAIQAPQVKSGAKSSTSRSWVNCQFSCFGGGKSFGSNLNPCLLMSTTEVEKVKCRLEEIITRMGCLSLRDNVMHRYDDTNGRITSTSLSEHQFFGREKEKAEIVKLLISEVKNGDATLCIVPIVGMGGVGKTALAQWLDNDAEVSNCFERRAWLCVSDVFNVLNITKSVLQSITMSPCEDKDFNLLQVKLKDNLSGKKFLVVLDDGSKIIVTTRNCSVASVKGFSPYPLERLSDDNCTSLLAFHALGTTNFESHPIFEPIGKKIAKRCKGIPLVAKILGGALRNKRNLRDWEDTLNKIPIANNNEILPILKLSYVHLPYYLKRCFSYCAVFPKDYEIERDELVLLWIMQGFLDGEKAMGNKLTVGQSYFNELVSRSFLQQSSVDASKFSMHDLLNDLAKSIEGKTCFNSRESLLVVNEEDASLEKARYAPFISSQFVTSECLRAYHRMKVLRSLILVREGFSRDSLHISNKVLHDLLKNLKYLRVFSLCHCYIKEVPNCVGDLKHLQYLNFSYTAVKSLPQSIVGLSMLQALILRGCKELSNLPQGITKLISLQFLDIRETRSLKEMPLGITNLKNLIILSKFVVGPEEGPLLKELQNLSRLQGELSISELQKVQEFRDALNANLLRKQGLRTLYLHWSVLRSLQPHTNLENLTISYFGGAIFPSWLGDPSYSKMVSLCLRGCPNVTSLPSLGQLPSLRELSLKRLRAPFSLLTTLKFKEMLAWKDWSPYAGGQEEEEVPFSCLQHLVVQSCPLLVGPLPFQLDHLIKLEIHSCPHLNNSTNKVCLPSLNELYLKDCNKVILKSLVKLTSLTILEIENLAELACFDHEFMSCLVKLKELHIRRCDKLTYLWQDENEMLNLTCLHELAIKDCPQFTYFVVREEEIELPCNLEMMKSDNCMSLEKLPSKMHTLKILIIRDCPKLTGGRLATLKALEIWSCKGVKSLEEFIVESLNSLYISDCENLVSLPRCLNMLSHLTSLEINHCPTLEIEDFPPLPVTLSSLALWNCPKIKSIASCNIAGCNNFSELTIWECLTLEIEEFPPLPITLSELTLCKCPKIKSLPNQWNQSTSLQKLRISSCQIIKRFPKCGLPPNLRWLTISECENLEKPMREWGLPLLTSLMTLTIEGRSMGGEGEKVWFPSEDDDEEDAWSLLFPSSLTYLCIYDMRQVEGLSRGLRNHLSSLQNLQIYNCPKLRDLPEDGLPPSLHHLYISRCEMILKDRCSEHTGDYWPLIQEIPDIDIR
ncbi:hypothetical protein BT93_K2243 [Corymbia citriodora subsp. variegata]|nr:hypothetical protein BT93_K2243 [Corymbia citriodora subsp. variegata]